MSMAIREIVMTEHIEELMPLLELHRDELATHKHIMKLNPDLQKYKEAERIGIFSCLGLYDGEKLIGYSAIIITNNWHYSDLIQAYSDVLYVHPDYRNKVWGVKLIKATQKMAKDKGAGIIFFHGKPNTVFESIMPRLGYSTQDIVFGKEL